MDSLMGSKKNGKSNYKRLENSQTKIRVIFKIEQ